MARAITTRSRGASYNPKAELPQGVQPGLKEFFTKPTGLDVFSSIDMLNTEVSPEVKNLRLWNGKYSVRPPVSLVGDLGTKVLVGLERVVLADGTERLVRWHTTGVEYLIGNIWTALTTVGTPLALTKYADISCTVWGDALLFADGVTGIYTINWTALTYEKIATAPICRHITTFGSRVVASYIISGGVTYPTRMQWCVKNDNTDWSGVGSGFEDLLSAPGGIVDTQLAAVPINDTEALVHRTGSVWLMQTTGYFDAPFTFQYLFGGLRCDSWKAITVIPGGSVVLGREDFYLVNSGTYTSIGAKVRAQLLATGVDPSKAQTTWDPQNREAIVYVPKRSMDGTSGVWRCQVDTQQWTYDEYQFNIKCLNQGSVRLTTAIDSLVGTIDSLLGKIDDLGASGIGGQYERGLIFASYGSNGFVGRENLLSATDLGPVGAGTTLPFTLATGLINGETAYRRTTFNRASVLYSGTKAVTVYVEYSTDGGTTWTVWSTLSCGISSQPVPSRGMAPVLERNQIQVRLRAVDAGGWSLQSLLIGAVQGGDILP